MKKYWVIAALSLPVAFVFLAVAISSIFAAFYYREIRMLAVIIGICSAACAVFTVLNYFRIVKMGAEGKLRPIVRIWTHNNETIVTSDEVYRLSLNLRDQLLVVFDWLNPKLRVAPLIFSIQSKERIVSITSEQLEAILDSCSICKTEMQISSGSGNDAVVNFEQMWRLLHGHDAEPPKV